jgi:adenine-specific DNA-methyltransferase
VKIENTMKRLTAVDPETKSTDIRAENLAALSVLFPELVTEGPDGVVVNLDVLKQLVGDQTVADSEEKYGLNWHGKRRARQLALTPSSGTLRPCPGDSVDWDTTQNLMIEGDNLEVLKLLQKSYAGKVKLICIDPPYNTGKDFVYPDNFQDNIKNYLELTGQTSEGGRKLSSNTEASGRFHTDWLSMMYPRLKLARNLLRDDGVLFATINDSEVSNLRLLLDDVFGAENFAASIAWKKRSSPDARDTIGSVHDSILCYVRSAELIKVAIGKMPLSEERIEAYANPDDDARGDWASVDMTGMTGRATAEQFFPVTLPSGREIGPPEGRSWGLAEKTFDELRADNRIWFGKTGDNVPRIKKFLSESDGQVVPSFWDMSDVGSNEEAKKEVNGLMGEPDIFDTPKPIRLLRRMIEIGTKKNEAAIVLDFFAGSGTTAQAMMECNVADSNIRRCVLIQLPEPLDPDIKGQKVAANFCDNLDKPRNIAELTKERLRRAGKKIREENPLFAGDLGFRVFKLASSNIRAWEPDRNKIAETLEASVEHLKTDRTEQDILFELLLKLGLDLCVPIEMKKVKGAKGQTHELNSIGGGSLLVCLSPNIPQADVEPLALGVVTWHKELKPAGETTVVFRDSAFADDVAKTNLTVILQQNGLENVRSL